jgi:ABC-type uncharacterized transport system permease subunit
MSLAASLDRWLEIGAAILYMVASVGFGAQVLLRHARLTSPGRAAAWGGVAIQTAAIGIHCATSRRTPFTGPADTLIACAWAVSLVYLILDTIVRPRPVALGSFALPISFLCLFGGAMLRLSRERTGPNPSQTAILDSQLISLHVVALLIAYGLLILAFGCAVLYLLQHRLLKQKRMVGGLFRKLPPLANIDHLAFMLVAFAFPLLSIGLLAGGIGLALGGLRGVSHTDPKMLLSVLMWLLYGIYLALHGMAHWRGPRANYLLLGGLAVILITLVAPSAHRFE